MRLFKALSYGCVPMPVLVINCGSTSIKAAVVEPDTGRRLAELKVERIGSPEATATFNDKAPTPCPSSCEEALPACLPELLRELPDEARITSVGHRIRKYIGAYAAVMGGVDAIVFTAGIGQNSAVVRHRVAQRLEFLGARLDEDRNRAASVTRDGPVAEISMTHSRTRLLVVQTDELWSIALQANDISQRSGAEPTTRIIPVAISARHVHLTQDTVEAIFGEGHELAPLKPLSQPGQFAATELVTLVGPKRRIERVRVLGPVRSKNQVEISRTDEFYLGVDAPIRASGDVANSPGITLIGTESRQVTLEEGMICAWRHIHMTPDDAAQCDVEDGDVVDVEVGTSRVRSLTFGDVLVRVKSSYKLEMHIDTDEGNAAELNTRDVGELERTNAEGTLRKTNRFH